MKFSFFLLALASLALLTACPERPSPAGPRAASPVPSWQIKLDVPENIPADKPVELQVRVFDETGKPVQGATVEVTLRMVTMDMGENKSKLSESQPGMYTGKGTFGMAGPWEAVVTAGKDNASMERKFPVLVK